MEGSVTVGILSDTHGFVHPQVLATVNACHHIVHAGDICGGHVLEQLQPSGGELLAVQGNNDIASNWPGESSYSLSDLPEESWLLLPGGKLAVIHGHQYWGRQDPQRAILDHFPRARAVVYGHSHYVQHDCQDGRWLLNPGAAGKRLNRGASSCLVLHARVGDWHVDLHRFPNDDAD